MKVRRPTRMPAVLVGALALVAALAVVMAAAYLYVELKGLPQLRTVQTAPEAPVALVFGAGLAANREVSPVLKRRLDTAVSLYRLGKVKKLLLSGNSEPHHDEIRAMRRYAQGQGVPEKDLLGDEDGLSTYDSCLRAHEVFGVQRAVLVTQRFHLPRALYVASALGIDATGVPADGAPGVARSFSARELLARPLAILYVLTNPRSR